MTEKAVATASEVREYLLPTYNQLSDVLKAEEQQIEDNGLEQTIANGNTMFSYTDRRKKVTTSGGTDPLMGAYLAGYTAALYDLSDKLWDAYTRIFWGYSGIAK